MALFVVTTAFNGARFLPACLNSVLRETEKIPHIPVEHIVVDAASTDSSINILQSWAAKQVAHSPNYSFRCISQPDH
jgi:glycosyltransferase involved in cell wall biosynthesis